MSPWAKLFRIKRLCKLSISLCDATLEIKNNGLYYAIWTVTIPKLEGIREISVRVTVRNKDTLELNEVIPLYLDKNSSEDNKSSNSASRNSNSEENSLSGQISLIPRDPIWIEKGWKLTSVLKMEVDGNDSDIDDDDDNSTPDSDNTHTG
ncbi:hypothetical protein BGZ76_000381, partial [Entomortierella beljakovae]